MTEHPGWLNTRRGTERVLTAPDGGRWLARVVEGGEVGLLPLMAAVQDRPPAPDRFRLVVEGSPTELEAQLVALDTVVRFRNGDLWDAIGVAIFRQVIRAAQSKKLYRVFCAAHGEQVDVGGGESRSLFPEPQAVLALDDNAFAELGLTFKRRPLRAAAAAYLLHGARWRALPAADLVVALQTVPRIGPWTAGAAVADWSNDYSLYPFGDLAVRTWAGRAAPHEEWPADEHDFSEHWRKIAAGRVSSLTLLVLAWGSQHGDIG